MTNNNTHNPDHTIGGGYPFNGVTSHNQWPVENRPSVTLDNTSGKVIVSPPEEDVNNFGYRTREVALIFLNWYNEWHNTQENIGKSQEELFDVFLEQARTQHLFEDYMMFRCAEFAEALKTAEAQIEDMLTDDPFSPELLGFELVHMNTDITEPPLSIYLSRYDDKYTLTRDNGELGTDTWNPARWILMEKLLDGSFKNTTLYLSCQRIAYAAFSAMGVKMRDQSLFESGEPVIGSEATHEVTYRYADPRGGGDISRTYKVNAKDNADAYRQAQKLLIEDYTEAGDVYTEALLRPGTESTNYFHAVNLNSQKTAMASVKKIVLGKPDFEVPGLVSREEIHSIRVWEEKRLLADYLKSAGHTHAVNFVRGDAKKPQFIKMVTVSAETDKDALTQAKFLLETDPDNPFEDVKFEELTIVK